ncbi:hypothetical protein C8A00DRAFT_10917 [Chaetomidium leptoderma]|uniref:Diels-Alderase n=1 Tax=Chaetomidium leptoderma TaxID=669021 RepID=A0AAN6VV95_9PEZI|nr:hypothetical protein C8A00DRAFT_10917 [Chaetomidium leptoderma]
MSATSVSYFDIAGDSVVPGPVPVASFAPGVGNVFPKYVDKLSDTAWELWYFDGGSDDGRTAFTVSFFRDARGLKEGGWRVQVFALWPDGAMWNKELYFPESIVTADGSLDGQVEGVWKERDNHSSVSFIVEPHVSGATLTFHVPGRVEGTVVMAAMDGNNQGLPPSEADALLCPDMYYLRPISLADAKANLVFHDINGAASSSREFAFTSGRGGMDRCWTPFSWPQLLCESYFLRANIGPYKMQLMRILSTEATGRKPYATARLWKGQKLVCAAQRAILPADLGRLTRDGPVPDQDAIVVEKVYENNKDGPGVAGAFRDKNVGYVVHFIRRGKEGERWRFETRHIQPWWNMPTSPPGPNATGNSAFLDTVSGGAQGEAWPAGTGGSGQLEL